MRNITRRILYLIVTGRSYNTGHLNRINVADIAPFCEAGELCCVFDEIELVPIDRAVLTLLQLNQTSNQPQ